MENSSFSETREGAEIKRGEVSEWQKEKKNGERYGLKIYRFKLFKCKLLFDFREF